MTLTHTTRYALIAAIASFLSVWPLSAAAFFTSSADASDNSFDIGTLTAEVDNDSFDFDLFSSSVTNFSFETTSTGTIDPQYRLRTEAVSCSSDFWNGLEVEVIHDSSPVFTGALSAFVASSTVSGDWDFEVTGSSTLVASENETCEAKIVIEAWQTVFPQFNTGGFFTEIDVTLTITAGEDIGSQPTANVVLNEIYPNVDNASSSPLNIEWVELYNGTGSSIDIEGWDLSEMSGVNENMILISSANTCAPGSQQGYARPYNGASTVIPAGGLLVVELCQNNVMNNNGDTIRLYDAGDTLVDSHTYGDTPKGKSHARIPDGGTWVDPIPTPGTPNTATKEELLDAGWDEEKISSVLNEPASSPSSNQEPETTEGTTKPVDQKNEDSEEEEKTEETENSEPLEGDVVLDDKAEVIVEKKEEDQEEAKPEDGEDVDEPTDDLEESEEETVVVEENTEEEVDTEVSDTVDNEETTT